MPHRLPADRERSAGCPASMSLAEGTDLSPRQARAPRRDRIFTCVNETPGKRPAESLASYDHEDPTVPSRSVAVTSASAASASPQWPSSLRPYRTAVRSHGLTGRPSRTSNGIAALACRVGQSIRWDQSADPPTLLQHPPSARRDPSTSARSLPPSPPFHHQYLIHIGAKQGGPRCRRHKRAFAAPERRTEQVPIRTCTGISKRSYQGIAPAVVFIAALRRPTPAHCLAQPDRSCRHDPHTKTQTIAPYGRARGTAAPPTLGRRHRWRPFTTVGIYFSANITERERESEADP
jgi:hypothetical protein